MALTDLTDTVWQLNDALATYPEAGTYGMKTYNVNIVTSEPMPEGTGGDPKDSFENIAIGYNGGTEDNEIRLDYGLTGVFQLAYGNDTKTLPDSWRSYFTGTFRITGGSDAKNSELIAWLESNCTNIIPPIVTIKYGNDVIAEMSDGGTKTLKTSGKYLSGDVSVVFNPEPTVWTKPEDWPDLDALELPTDRSENVVYVLYDRKCGFDPVSFGVATSSTRITVHKGNVVDGEFVGELVASNVAKYTDTLTDEYTVYRLSGSFDRFFFHDYPAGGGYDVSLQSVVWVRGTAPFIKELGSPYNNREFASIHTQAFELYDVASLTYIVLNTNAFRSMPMYRFYLGVDENGDFGGNTLTRTGGGPMFFQPIGAKDEVVIQNANYGNLASDTFSGVTRLRLRNVTANISGNRFQGAIWLKSLVVEDSCNITFDSVYGSFFYCESLVVLDLHPVDFSGATAASNTFSGCRSLKELRLNDTWTFDINLSNAMSLEKDSVTQLFNDLGTIETAHTITLPYGMKNYLLTAEEIAVITEKGWTVA